MIKFIISMILAIIVILISIPFGSVIGGGQPSTVLHTQMRICTGIDNPSPDAIKKVDLFVKSQSSGVKAQQLGEEIVRLYKSGTSIIDISKKLDLPPFSIVRQLLVENKYDAKSIETMFLSNKFPDFIKISNDPLDPSSPHSIQARHRTIADAIQNITYKLNTPHSIEEKTCIIFTTPVIINSKKIKWIYVIHEMITNNSYLLNKLSKKIDKLHKKYKPHSGAIVLLNSFDKSLQKQSILKKHMILENVFL